MSTAKNQKQSMLFALGCFIAISASGHSYIEQSVGFLSVALVTLGAFLVLVSLISKGKSHHQMLDAFEWNRVGFFMIAILFSMIFLTVVNSISHRLSYRWDVTQNSQHTLTQATIDFVSNIQASAEKPVELTALYVGLAPSYLQDLLDEYERISNGKISITIVDPIEDIAYAAKFGNVISSEQSKLIVTYGDERKDIDFSSASLNEEQITNALARITREQRHVYFLTGHRERPETSETNEGLSLFAQLLAANNITSKSLLLGSELKIPEDCDVLIVAGPRTQLSDAETLLINAYLKQGGDALFLIEAVELASSDGELSMDQLDKNPSLNSILNQWGVNVGNDIVVDLTSHVGGDQGSPATRNYIEHEAITDGLDYTFYIRPRSITELRDRRASIKLAPIALSESNDKSWAETDRSLNVSLDDGVDIPGPVAISYVIWEGKEKSDKSDTRIIVVTDVDFLSNVYINQYSNAAMGLNVVNWLSELDYAVFNDIKNIKVERLDLTSKQRRMVVTLLFLMPLLIGLIGLFVWMRS